MRGAPVVLLSLSLASPCGAASPAVLNNVPSDVARSMSACWHPPREGDEITLRMSFRRDGSVFGRPIVTYVKAADGEGEAAALAVSALRAVAACTPLRFTPSLGAAIAGRIFLIRFVARRPSRAAAL